MYMQNVAHKVYVNVVLGKCQEPLQVRDDGAGGSEAAVKDAKVDLGGMKKTNVSHKSSAKTN